MTTHILIEEEKEEKKVEAAPVKAGPVGLPPFTPTIPANSFSDCLLETTGDQRKLHRRSILFSTTLQALVVGFLVLLPLLYTDVLPTRQLATWVMTAPPPPPPPPLPAPVVARRAVATSNILNGQLVAPTRIPAKIQIFHQDEAPVPATSIGVPGGVLGGIPGGQPGGVIGGILKGMAEPSHPPVVRAPTAPPERVRISQGVSEGMLLTKIKPEYPTIARVAHVEGSVVLEAGISREGLIENLRVVSGNPLLVPPTLDAVRQWRYRPYSLNGSPVEVETKIIVIFQMDGRQ